MPIIERYTRRTGMFSKVEAVYGTAETVFNPTDALLFVEPPEFTIETDNVPRNLALPWMGNGEELPSTSRAKLKFKVEMVGSGAAGTPPAWGKLLLGCGFAETITAANRVEYSLLNDTFSGLTHRFIGDGVRYTARGSRGMVSFDLTAYQVPTMSFEFWGFDAQRLAAIIPSIDLSGYQAPEPITDTNTGNIVIGGTLTAGVISGGTNLNSKGLTVDLGNKLSHRKLLGAAERIAITGRAVTMKSTLELDAATEVQWATDIRANTLTTLGFQHGTTAGKRIGLFFARAQRKLMQRVDDDGNLMFDVDFNALPTLTGGTEMVVIAR